MTKDKLIAAVASAKAEARTALQLLVDNLNAGQKKKIVRQAEVRAMLDRFGVDYDA